LNLPSSPDAFPSDMDVLSYSRWQDILRSWFWRYYDHLLQLTLYNFGWFLTCFGVGWFAGFLGILGKPQQWNWFSIYIVYVLECVVSVIWALAVFKIVIDDVVSWRQLIIGLRRYFWKALISASLSGLVLALALYNLRFYFSFQVSSHIWIFILMGFVATVFLYGLMMTFYQWPLLFFQDPPLGKLFYRSFLITLGAGPNSLLLLLFSVLAFFLFFLEPFLWFFIGFVFLFSLYTVALEKHFLRYKITYQDKPIGEYLESMDRERQRSWRDIFKPWETR
jgi:hypothetical protein